MTFFAVIGIILFTLFCLHPLNTLLGFFGMSDYGLVDTFRWNFFKEKLWIEFVWILVSWPVWWFTIGQHVKIGWK